MHILLTQNSVFETFTVIKGTYDICGVAITSDPTKLKQLQEK
jgi:hypothetical protein